MSEKKSDKKENVNVTITVSGAMNDIVNKIVGGKSPYVSQSDFYRACAEKSLQYDYHEYTEELGLKPRYCHDEKPKEEKSKRL